MSDISDWEWKEGTGSLKKEFLFIYILSKLFCIIGITLNLNYLKKQAHYSTTVNQFTSPHRYNFHSVHQRAWVEHHERPSESIFRFFFPPIRHHVSDHTKSYTNYPHRQHLELHLKYFLLFSFLSCVFSSLLFLSLPFSGHWHPQQALFHSLFPRRGACYLV